MSYDIKPVFHPVSKHIKYDHQLQDWNCEYKWGNDDITECVIVRINQIDTNGAGILNVIDFQNGGKSLLSGLICICCATVAC